MKFTILLISGIIVLSSCEKKVTCANSMQLTATTITPTVGDDVVITAPRESDNEVYQWNGPKLNEISGFNTVTLDDIKLSQRGKYSCTKANSDCNTALHDTIFIDVKLKQETPPCALTNNTIVCSNIPGVNFSSVTQGFDPTFNAVGLYGNGPFGYPSFTVLFNSYNGNTEPLDGTYITSNKAVFDILQEPNEISVSFIYASNYYHCHAGQKVYVTHAAGKLQVSFCNLVFGSPPAPNTTCTGKMTEL